MATYDPSHDFHHVSRVRKTALRIAKRVEDEKGIGSIDVFALELAALFHDLYEQVFFWSFVLINDDTNSPAVRSTLKVMTVPSWRCSSKATKALYLPIKLETFQISLRMCRTVRRSSE